MFLRGGMERLLELNLWMHAFGPSHFSSWQSDKHGNKSRGLLRHPIDFVTSRMAGGQGLIDGRIARTAR